MKPHFYRCKREERYREQKTEMWFVLLYSRSWHKEHKVQGSSLVSVQTIEKNRLTDLLLTSARCSLRASLMSSVTREEFGAKPLYSMPPGSLPRVLFQTWGTWGDHGEDPGNTGVTLPLGWPGNALETTWRGWRKCPSRRNSGSPCSDCFWPREAVDGWMDAYSGEILLNSYLRIIMSWVIILSYNVSRNIL